MQSTPHNSPPPALKVAERRRDKRTPAAFGFWYQAGADAERRSAWMLNTSVGGAAFLTAAETAPAVEDLLLLTEMHTNDDLVREHAGGLPRAARVLRIEAGEGLTRRIAVRFETAAEAGLTSTQTRIEPRTLPQSLVPPIPPAFAATGRIWTARNA
ncbi:hypothetical protein RAS1_10980 [Phycisphaerae bacterium RAS1]|nr:hypothetical protein RAS1_10980 [Phycisphaerae bacterium RAS1]